ncbi:MAG: alpha/beta fold hydrolase [Oscillospiraceae bacterium]|jgi:esterase/lipase|nr:alpha/beta fold hydrolase [Oscillospiraceae bacterium]
MIVFVHGFCGSPKHLERLVAVAEKCGHRTTSVLLKGHNSQPMEFVTATAEDWEQNLADTLNAIDEDIILVGHSIGGLLCISAAASGRWPISGVFSIAAPLKVRLFSPQAAAFRLKILFTPARRRFYMAQCAVKISFPTILLWGRVLLQPHRLIRRTLKVLDNMTVPVELIYSHGDETAKFSSAQTFHERLAHCPHRIVTLEKSGHVQYEPSEWATIERELADFLGNAAKHIAG